MTQSRVDRNWNIQVSLDGRQGVDENVPHFYINAISSAIEFHCHMVMVHVWCDRDMWGYVATIQHQSTLHVRRTIWVCLIKFGAGHHPKKHTPKHESFYHHLSVFLFHNNTSTDIISTMKDECHSLIDNPHQNMFNVECTDATLNMHMHNPMTSTSTYCKAISIEIATLILSVKYLSMCSVLPKHGACFMERSVQITW